jgi:hypothetical protein
MIQQKTITLKNPLRASSLHWEGDTLVDRVNGSCYKMDGSIESCGSSFRYHFDSAIVSPDGSVVVIYEKLGTKGLVLKDGKLIREINRSFYHAHIYEYPIALFQLPDGQNAIIHCPDSYDRLEVELVDSGERITASDKRDSPDFFHSRLVVNPSGTRCLSAGWIWQPWDYLAVIDLEKGLTDPIALDEYFCPEVHGQISSASFLDDHKILISVHEEGSEQENEADLYSLEEVGPEILPSRHCGIFDLEKNTWIKRARTALVLSNMQIINKDYAWDFYKFPKVINLNTGEIVDSCPDIFSGDQYSAFLIKGERQPALAFSEDRKKMAVGLEKGIAVLSFEE